MANSHPGSYCGQDAYTDMFVTEKKNEILHRERSVRPVESVCDGRSIELYARSTGNFRGGGGTELNESTTRNGEEGGDGMNDVSTVVRRLTPL